MHRSAQNRDDQLMVMEDEIKNMRRIKFVLDVAALEIIDHNHDEDFINAAVENINQIDLIIHVIDHDIIYQYWSLKSGDSINSSSCHHQHQRDHHHQHQRGDDDDDDKEMIMITCQPTCPPEVTGKLLVDQGVFASHDDHRRQNVVNDVAHEDHAAAADDDEYIMSLLHDVDVLYEFEKLPTYEHLVEVKRCIMQRISEAKPAVLMEKPKTVRIRVDLSTILKKYYANPAAATSAAAQDAIELSISEELCALHDFPPKQRSPAPQLYEMKPASRLSREALKTKTFEKEDLISSSSLSCSCTVCSIEFRVGVDEIKIMPCSHMFHWTCLTDWLKERNTCPVCNYELPTWNCFQDYK